MLENLTKAADVARTIASEASRNAPLHISLFVLAATFASFPAEWLPPEVRRFQWAGVFLAVFLGAHILLHLWFGYRPIRKLKWHCRNLATDEREVLSSYLKEDVSCRYYGALHGPTNVLIGKGILGFASGLFDAFEAPIMIQPVARDYLRKHPDLIGLTTKDFGTEKPKGKMKTKSLLPDE